MKAFEDVQATARAMKVDLKERRSEVLDLKTNLQRVRASNERRRAKVSERWAARMAAAAEERAAAADRHRAFARQLKGDVDALEEKLGGLERQVGRFREGRDRDCVVARAESARELKKAREAWMAAEKGRLQRLSEKKAGAIKQAAVRALEPQLTELVKANRAEARARADELGEVLLGLQASLERESSEKVQMEARDYQLSLEGEVEEERRQAEHQVRLLGRSNEADIQEFREATRRDLEGERVRFEAGRKRAREAAGKELEGARSAEASRAALAADEHARELRGIEEAHRQEEAEARRRLAEETGRWQKQVQASARKGAEEHDEIAKREAREKVCRMLAAVRQERGGATYPTRCLVGGVLKCINIFRDRGCMLP
ncbi:hypothetical protein Esi_0103_0077 [Ectocarpus siliculosus]|uniref:Uncharacterized protein n=1 Tax=Ectocarpus siliculosus TaxID=2880 RepID=D8LCH7_ECTSI|nr:hypothetical protein Esi_0103_0077 [Ectocarpus siliculosus]|eukprot:CBN78213.1 hypothetical protein Esi_0103_0077 [Ectocarpus siliculosus]